MSIRHEQSRGTFRLRSLAPFVGVIVGACSTLYASEKPPLRGEDVFSRYSKCVVVVRAFQGSQQVSFGSGVVVASDGYVATNAHVIEDADNVEVAIPQVSGSGRDTYEAAIKYFDPTADIAILKVPVLGLRSIALPEPGRHPMSGKRVFALGSPLGLENTISDGVVSGERTIFDHIFLQHSAPISPGSSGGPLISEDGDFLGLNTIAIKDAQNLNFAIPAYEIKAPLSIARKVKTATSPMRKTQARRSSPLKPGKWQITMQTEMPGVPFKIPPVTMSQCVKPEDLESPEKSVPKASKDNKCKVSDYKIEGNKVTWTVTCEDKEKTSGTGEITYTDSSYEGTMKMTSGGQDVTTKMKGTRLGDCQ